MNRSPDHPISRSPSFLLSAGEASGDTYGAQLAEALRGLLAQSRPADPSTHTEEPTFFGMGGDKMRAAGCELLVEAREIAVVGLVEVVRHLPAIRRRFRYLVAEAARRRPAAAILIDFPDFNLRLARELHRLGIPVFYFVSPQIWAWRTGRVQQVRKYVRKMIVIFPFEQEFYRGHGVEVSYVGHPLAYAPPPPAGNAPREAFAAQHGLDPARQWIALLPGSRRKEFRLNLPPMLQAAAQLEKQGRGFQFLLPVASTLSAEWVREQLSSLGFSAPGPKPQSESASTAAPVIHLTENARATLMHARAGVVASGTATVEAALSGTPFIVVYRLAPLTWLLGRRLVRLDTFAMPNLIAAGGNGSIAGGENPKKIIPELIQRDFTAANVLRELEAILPDGPARRQMQDALKMVQECLRDPESAEPPTVRAAREILAGLTVAT